MNNARPDIKFTENIFMPKSGQNMKRKFRPNWKNLDLIYLMSTTKKTMRKKTPK